MHRHLVAVKVGIETLASQRVKHNRVTFHQHRFKRLNAHAMEGGGAVEQDRVLMNDLLHS